MKPPVVRDPLFLLDYDGTLAEVAERPHLATPHEDVPALLQELHRRHPVYVVTGRQVSDLGQLLRAPGLRVVGIHGIEAGRIDGPVELDVPDRVLTEIDRLRGDTPDIAGLEVEDKRAAVALHYRNAQNPRSAEERLREWADHVPDALEPLWGKMVLEIRPRGYDKGAAARRLIGEYPSLTPVVLGDDTTDEEMFDAVEEGVTIKVGPGDTVARHRLEGVDAVVAYLRSYLES